jgi:hypothetical protein
MGATGVLEVGVVITSKTGHRRSSSGHCSHATSKSAGLEKGSVSTEAAGSGGIIVKRGVKASVGVSVRGRCSDALASSLAALPSCVAARDTNLRNTAIGPVVMSSTRRGTLLRRGSRTLKLEAVRAGGVQGRIGRLGLIGDSKTGTSAVLQPVVNQAVNPKLVAVPAGDIPQSELL